MSNMLWQPQAPQDLLFVDYLQYLLNRKPPATDILGMNFSTANFALAEVCAVGWLDGQGLPKGF